MNLVKNAIDILREREGERQITISASQDDKETTVLVEDSGGGIDKSIIDKVFDPYFSTKKEKHGMGLGLYMSQLIIQEHCGGKLDVVNGEKGACFSIVIPSHAARSQS